MNKLVKRYMILFFVIIIPLLATYLVGAYGYKSPKFGQGIWKDEFTEPLMTFKGSTEEQIEGLLKYGLNNQYYLYDKTPIYSHQATHMIDNEALPLFKLDIYRAIFQTTYQNELVDRFQYLYFIYDVQYLNIRETFDAEPDSELKNAINATNVPVVTINIYPLEENDEVGEKGVVSLVSSVYILDEGADVKLVSGKQEGAGLPVYIVHGFNSGFRLVEDGIFSERVKIEVIATVKGIKDHLGADITSDLASITLGDYKLLLDDVDISDYVKSNQQEPTGYFAFVFKKYLWWIGLITFSSVGLITGSFYIVWRAEEIRDSQMKKNKKVKK